jgi:hypothetical protein
MYDHKVARAPSLSGLPSSTRGLVLPPSLGVAYSLLNARVFLTAMHQPLRPGIPGAYWRRFAADAMPMERSRG